MLSNVGWVGNGGSDNLWIGHYVTGNFSAPEDLTEAGSLGSAPTIAEDSATGNIYIFWTSSASNRDLWEGYYNSSTGNWSVQNLGMGPLT